jgi:four helix bundle protein
MMGGALKELDETAYWLELLVEGEIVPASKLIDLQKETDELTAIFVSSINTVKRNNSKKG